MRFPLTTWSERGVPFVETRARLVERSTAECHAAFLFFNGPEGMTASQLRAFSTAAAQHESTRAILDEVEPHLREFILSEKPHISAQELDVMMEIYGLLLEMFGRIARDTERQRRVLQSTLPLYLLR